MSTPPEDDVPLTRAARRAAERAAGAESVEPIPSVSPAPSEPAPERGAESATVPAESADPGAVTRAAAPTNSADAAPTRALPVVEPSGMDALFNPPTDETPEVAPVTPRKTAPVAKRRPRTSVVGVLGELLITAGVLVMLYLVWQLWFNDMVERNQQNAAAVDLSQQWDADAAKNPPVFPESGEPPAIAQPEDGVEFAILQIPRFGADYGAPLAGGVSKAKTLDKAGIGHYPDTQLPGQPGNFALAGHRNTHGAPLNLVADLQLGDAIVVATPEGWYTYRYRNSEYVTPSAVEVLNPIPQSDSAEISDSVITLTSCNPKMSTAERIISYGVFESFTPRGDTPPASLASPQEG